MDAARRGRRRTGRGAGRDGVADQRRPGAALLRRVADARLDRSSPDFARRASSATVRDWQGDVLDLVRRRARPARRRPDRVVRRERRRLSVMLAVFAQHRRAHRRRGAGRRRHDGAVAEGAGGGVRRPGRPGARRRRPAPTCCERVERCWPARRRGSPTLLARARAADAPATPRRLERAAAAGRAGRAPVTAPLPGAARRAVAGGAPSESVALAAGARWTEVVELGDGRLDDALLDEAARLSPAGPASGCGCRRAHTVVALAGATGSGKSSLFNALAGERSSPGRACAGRRPASRTRWSGTPTAPARCWTGSRSRAGTPRRPRRTTLPTGWCCSTCPTTTHRVAHRLEVDRLVELVDLLVWVLDPQKYADAAIHDRYLRPLAGHGDVMVVVLNQVDRLDPGGRPRTPWPTCAGCWPTTGCRTCRCWPCRRRPATGLDRLRDVLTGAVAAHAGRAAAARGGPRTTCSAALAGRGRRRRAGTTSTAGHSARWSPRWRRGGRDPRRRRRGASGRAGTGPPRRPACRSPAGCAGCGRTRCAGCT